jgi:hypothetical protein
MRCESGLGRAALIGRKRVAVTGAFSAPGSRRYTMGQEFYALDRNVTAYYYFKVTETKRRGSRRSFATIATYGTRARSLK